MSILIYNDPKDIPQNYSFDLVIYVNSMDDLEHVYHAIQGERDYVAVAHIPPDLAGDLYDLLNAVVDSRGMDTLFVEWL